VGFDITAQFIQLGRKYCRIFSEFGVRMKLDMLIEMCLIETYSKVCR
jgi:hypothetical protein